MKILIAGYGNMGRTYAHSFINSRFIEPQNLLGLTRRPVTETDLIKGLAPDNFYTQTDHFITACDIMLLAVKPQDFATLARHLKPYLHKEQIIFSLMAGITVATISAELGCHKVVRAMPNLPAQIGMGMTVFTCSTAIDKKELFIMQNLINTTGKSVYVEDERMIDAATAISGSGPAYVYYYMQAMIDAGVAMGFSPSQAELLVNQTLMGAVHLHNQNDYTCREWIQKVASKGGTTEAALGVFEQQQVAAGIQLGLQAAFNRAKELGS
jgi:pyrroline-5-carboxylate reductase